MIRTPEDLLAFYEAELSEKDAIQACDELVLLTQQPGWRRVLEWLSRGRDNAFQQLRHVQGDSRMVAESFWKWQQIDLIYEGLESFIRLSIEHGEDIRRRQTDALQESFLRGEIYGRSDPGSSPASAGASGDPAPTGGNVADSY